MDVQKLEQFLGGDQEVRVFIEWEGGNRGEYTLRRLPFGAIVVFYGDAYVDSGFWIKEMRRV